MIVHISIIIKNTTKNQNNTGAIYFIIAALIFSFTRLTVALMGLATASYIFLILPNGEFSKNSCVFFLKLLHLVPTELKKSCLEALRFLLARCLSFFLSSLFTLLVFPCCLCLFILSSSLASFLAFLSPRSSFRFARFASLTALHPSVLRNWLYFFLKSFLSLVCNAAFLSPEVMLLFGATLLAIPAPICVIPVAAFILRP